jgi:ketopantoate reductase
MTANFPPPSDIEPLDPNLLTTMYIDLLANRPLQFEVYLGNPVRMATDLDLRTPYIESIYAIARHINKSIGAKMYSIDLVRRLQYARISN